MTIKQKTDARITTQLALRDTVEQRKFFEKNIANLISNEISGKKKSRKNVVALFDKTLDEAYKGAVISKLVQKDTAQRTSKHNSHQWMYLHYDAKKPYTRREEHLIEIYYTEMKSKKPENYIEGPLGIYITRHFLERAALRLNATCIEDMVQCIRNHVKLSFSFDLRKRCFENKGLVFVTCDEYVILDSIDEKRIILKTIVPRSEWSKTKSKKLSLILEELGNKNNIDKFNDIAILEMEQFNNKDIISSYDVDINYFHNEIE